MQGPYQPVRFPPQLSQLIWLCCHRLALGGSGQGLGALTAFSAHGRCSSFARHGCLWHLFHASRPRFPRDVYSFPGCIFVQASGYRRVAPSMYIRKHARGAGGIQCSHPSEGQRPYPSDSLWASLQKLPDMLGCFRMRRPFNVFYIVPETRPVQSGLMRSNAVSMLNDDEDETAFVVKST